MRGDPDRLFVYGTLLAAIGHPLGRALGEACVHEGAAWLRARLHDLGEYPGAVLSSSPGDCVVGELYRLPHDGRDALLAALDGYEDSVSEDGEFVRAIVRVERADGSSIPAFAYLLRGNGAGRPLIADGDYAAHRRAGA